MSSFRRQDDVPLDVPPSASPSPRPDSSGAASHTTTGPPALPPFPAAATPPVHASQSSAGSSAAFATVPSSLYSVRSSSGSPSAKPKTVLHASPASGRVAAQGHKSTRSMGPVLGGSLPSVHQNRSPLHMALHVGDDDEAGGRMHSDPANGPHGSAARIL